VRLRLSDRQKIDGLVLEFGVLRGRSLRQIANHYNDRTVYGFDTFEGLIEDWGDLHGKGAMTAKGKLPEDMPDNVKIVKGLIEDTLPEFLELHKGTVAFAHIDTDTYTPAKCVLDHIAKRLVVGSIILFDEFRDYPGYEEHEFKAFREFKAANPGITLEEMDLKAPGVFSILRNPIAYGFKDIIKSVFTRPVDISKAIYNRWISKKAAAHPQAAFRVVKID